MAENPHYRELLQLLNEFDVEYLIVGGFAVMKYGEPRYTKDLDVWVHNSPQNSLRLIGALKKFGAPLEHDGITAETFTEKQVVYQIGISAGCPNPGIHSRCKYRPPRSPRPEPFFQRPPSNLQSRDNPFSWHHADTADSVDQSSRRD